MGVFYIALETFTLLRRDRVFVPALLTGLFFVIFANLASDWSVSDFTKILFDSGTFGYRFTGIAVALFWGTKIIGDTRLEGSLETALAAPISRSAWLAGRFTGLVLALLALALVYLIFWQTFMILTGFPVMTSSQLYVFFLLTLEWIVCGAIATFFSAFASNAVALFASIAVVLVGLVSHTISQTLGPNTSEWLKGVVGGLAYIWNLQQFNLVDMATQLNGPGIAPSQLVMTSLYGIGIIAVLVSAGCLVFEKIDAIR